MLMLEVLYACMYVRMYVSVSIYVCCIMYYACTIPLRTPAQGKVSPEIILKVPSLCLILLY